MISIERMEFYDRAKQAFADIQTGEPQFRGCLYCKKALCRQMNKGNT